jgi:hypothetical protein
VSAICYVVTVHDGGGSMVEAADARYAFGLFTSGELATKAAEKMSDAITCVSHHHRDEWWATVQEIFLPGAAVGSTVGNLTDEQVTAEVERIVDAEQERWDADLG